jgi:HSF-type DNA-binding
MMDRCDPEIATWSISGDNFVVKDVEKFSTLVLPLYFKHSNFSSFARQLNFYGFRKLRTDPILTSDVDPSTACYVRFYHDKFQKDKPELLHHIKRATKSDQQSKDDVDSLKEQVHRLKDCITHMSMDMDRKMAEMSYEYNKKITALSAEYDKLAGLVSQVLTSTSGGGISSMGGGVEQDAAGTIPACSIRNGTEIMESLSRVAAMRGGVGLPPPLSSATAGATPPPVCFGTIGSNRLGAGIKRPAPEEELRSD